MSAQQAAGRSEPEVRARWTLNWDYRHEAHRCVSPLSRRVVQAGVRLLVSAVLGVGFIVLFGPEQAGADWLDWQACVLVSLVFFLVWNDHGAAWSVHSTTRMGARMSLSATRTRLKIFADGASSNELLAEHDRVEVDERGILLSRRARHVRWLPRSAFQPEESADQLVEWFRQAGAEVVET
ncbi:MAG: hypothetical protein AAF533_28935 [Acidobacteriota bacterium]